jgi:cytochrome P450
VATTLRMTLLYLINTPQAYRRLQAELDNASLSSPITDVEARSLPYLQAVIREGLRIFPGVATPFFKIVPPEGDVVASVRLPPGTLVGHDAFGVLRSKKYWGPDADVFRPERWLGLDDEDLACKKEAIEVQFGYGRYKCLGRGIAAMELNKALPEVSHPRNSEDLPHV